jgi:hypothetical protein
MKEGLDHIHIHLLFKTHYWGPSNVGSIYVERHSGGEKQSALMGSITTIYYNKNSHSHMMKSHDWLKLNINNLFLTFIRAFKSLSVHWLKFQPCLNLHNLGNRGTSAILFWGDEPQVPGDWGWVTHQQSILSMVHAAPATPWRNLRNLATHLTRWSLKTSLISCVEV